MPNISEVKQKSSQEAIHHEQAQIQELERDNNAIKLGEIEDLKATD